jgi:hypothetical protein
VHIKRATRATHATSAHRCCLTFLKSCLEINSEVLPHAEHAGPDMSHRTCGTCHNREHATNRETVSVHAHAKSKTSTQTSTQQTEYSANIEPGFGALTSRVWQILTLRRTRPSAQVHGGVNVLPQSMQSCKPPLASGCGEEHRLFIDSHTLLAQAQWQSQQSPGRPHDLSPENHTQLVRAQWQPHQYRPHDLFIGSHTTLLHAHWQPQQYQPHDLSLRITHG